VGRLALVAAAIFAIWAFTRVPRSIPDRSSLAIARINRLHEAEAKFHDAHGRFGNLSELTLDTARSEVVQYFVFSLKTRPAGYFVRAIPVDPRQKSFYSNETGVIRFAPGNQAANSDSPVIE
jgi:hypothetical protein